MSKNEFFFGTCIGIGDAHNAFLKKIQTSLKILARDLSYYIKKLNGTTWEQLKAFQEKKERLGELQQQANQLLQQWREEKDPVKKRLHVAYLAKLQESKIFSTKLEKILFMICLVTKKKTN